MFGMAGQEERDEHSAVLSWNEYVAFRTKVWKGTPIPLPFFAFVAECIIWSLSRCTKDTDLKSEQVLFRFTPPAPDRTRLRDPQPIVGR